MGEKKNQPLKGKVYSDYLREDQKRNWKSAERLRLAIKAKKEREARGIDISLPKLNINPNVQREAKPEYASL